MFSLVAIPGGGAMFSLVAIVLLMVIDACCYNTVITLHIEVLIFCYLRFTVSGQIMALPFYAALLFPSRPTKLWLVQTEHALTTVISCTS